MQVFATLSNRDYKAEDLDKASEAVATLFGDGASATAIRDILVASKIVMPAHLTLEVRGCLAEHGIDLDPGLEPTVGIPGSELELALPMSYRASSIISRLLGEEEGDIPVHAVYDVLDLMSAVDCPASEDEIGVIGEVLARAVLGITGQVPEPIKAQAGLLQYQNAYTAKQSELIDPDAESAPEED